MSKLATIVSAFLWFHFAACCKRQFSGSEDDDPEIHRSSKRFAHGFSEAEEVEILSRLLRLSLFEPSENNVTFLFEPRENTLTLSLNAVPSVDEKISVTSLDHLEGESETSSLTVLDEAADRKTGYSSEDKLPSSRASPNRILLARGDSPKRKVADAGIANGENRRPSKVRVVRNAAEEAEILTKLEKLKMSSDSGSDSGSALAGDLKVLSLNEPANLLEPYLPFASIYHEWEELDYSSRYDSTLNKAKAKVIEETHAKYSGDPIIVLLRSAFELNSITSLFHVLSRACEYQVQSAVRSILRIKDAVIIETVLSLVVFCIRDFRCHISMVGMLIKSETILPPSLISTFFSRSIGAFSEAELISFIQIDIPEQTLLVILEGSEVTERLLAEALDWSKSDLIILTMASCLSTCSTSVVIKAFLADYPQGTLDLLVSICDTPQIESHLPSFFSYIN